MKYKYLSLFIVLILSVLNFILLKRINLEQNNAYKLINDIELLSHKLENEKHINKLLQNNILTSICNFSWEIDPYIVVQDFDKKKRTIKELLNTDFTLFFKFADTDCSICIDQQIQLLKDISIFTNNKVKPVFLGEFSNWQSFNYYKSKYDLNDLYFISPDQIRINYNSQTEFILILIDKEFKTKFLYIPIKETPEIISQFVQNLKKNLYNQL